MENQPTNNAAPTSTAETAHLIGPGCLRLRGRLPLWRPVNGNPVVLHPKFLKRIFFYGTADVSGVALRLFWQNGIQVVYFSPNGHKLLGRLQPMIGSSNLARLQHLAASDQTFCLQISRELVREKIAGTESTLRYFQRQGKGQDAGSSLSRLKNLQARLDETESLDVIRGTEGAAAATWFRFLATLLPKEWNFNRRQPRPAPDPMNSILSLGYTLLMAQCQTLLAAYDLDPFTGFLHTIRPGRPSLACDMIEPFRVTLVDRLIVTLIRLGTLNVNCFQVEDNAFRLKPDTYRMFLGRFEAAFRENATHGSFHKRMASQVEELCSRIRSTS